jgi:hypothetical protein
LENHRQIASGQPAKTSPSQCSPQTTFSDFAVQFSQFDDTYLRTTRIYRSAFAFLPNMISILYVASSRQGDMMRASYVKLWDLKQTQIAE